MSAPAVSISGVLRVAVLASSPAEQGRLAALVGQCGHRIVGPGASPDAVLTDGTAAATLPAAAVAIGAVNEAFAGLLPPDAAAAQGRCCAAGRRGGANRAHAGSTASNFRVAARGTADPADTARNRGARRSPQRPDQQGNGAVARDFRRIPSSSTSKRCSESSASRLGPKPLPGCQQQIVEF